MHIRRFKAMLGGVLFYITLDQGDIPLLGGGDIAPAVCEKLECYMYFEVASCPFVRTGGKYLRPCAEKVLRLAAHVCGALFKRYSQYFSIVKHILLAKSDFYIVDSVLAALKSDYIASVRLGDGVFQVALDGSDRLVGVYLGRRFTALILLKAEGEAALAAVVAVFDYPARNGSRIGSL